MLLILDAKSFALYCTIPNSYNTDGAIKNIEEPISELWVYLYDDSVYIVRSTDERQTDSSKREFAVYKAKDNSELYDTLNPYIDENGDGIFYCTIPDWLNKVKRYGSIYLSPVLWEFYFVFLFLKIINQKTNNDSE